jgi:cell fate regulator YaaT (PSP1 superfamily)
MEQPFLIGIKFQKGGKIYHFDASQCRDLKQNDFVVVETARGRQLGEVIYIVTSPKPQDYNVKPIHRKATPRDLVLRQIWRCKEAEAVVNCRSKAKELGFADIKFVGAEFSFDGTRLTLMYNSDEGGDKPDLRNLRRAMSRLYPHAQIEMHPMGPRDVAKLLGGMGACGLEERCCTAYLTDFSPISIKMAKEQGISLTPTEITGMCGRLRCCLAYEFEQYTDARKTLPKKNKRVLTPHGEGKVLEVLPLKGAVLVVLETGVFHEYPAHEIQLFDENGVPIPRTPEQDFIEAIQDDSEKPGGDEQIESQVYTDEKPSGISKPTQPENAQGKQQPGYRKGYQGHPSRERDTNLRDQKSGPNAESDYGEIPREKTRPHQGPGQGVNRQPTTNRPVKGNRPQGQRRNRGRRQ